MKQSPKGWTVDVIINIKLDKKSSAEDSKIALFTCVLK